MSKDKIISMEKLNHAFLYGNKLKYSIIKNKKYNTLICDSEVDPIKIKHIKSIKNIVIIPDKFFSSVIDLRNFENVENIYFDMYLHDEFLMVDIKNEKEKGLIIDYNILSMFSNLKNIDIRFSDKQAKIFNKAKIVCLKKEIPINIYESVNRVTINKHTCNIDDDFEDHDKPVDINFYTDTEIYTYTIDLHLNLKQSKKIILDKYYYCRIDIKDIRDYDGVDKNFLSLKELIINTSDINNINNTDISNIKFKTNKLVINDDDDMRLFPQSTTFDINKDINVIPLKDKISICSNGMFNNFIINVDKDYNITRIDDKTLKTEHKNIDNIYNVSGKYGYLIVIKHKKKDKYTLITDDNKIYKINKLFNKYFYGNTKKYYYRKNAYPYDKNGLQVLNYIDPRKPDFKDQLNRIYSGYKKYLKDLKKKLESGLTNKELYDLLFDTCKKDDTDVHKKIVKKILKGK